MTFLNNKSLLPYGLAILFIGGWWTFAFNPLQHTHSTPSALTPQLHPELPSLNRKILHEALAGNYTLMAQLIADWDINAQQLAHQNNLTVKRLSDADLLKSQLLGQQLSSKPLPSTPAPRLLPQTNVAASFLLALTPQNQIVALPKGLREQTKLFATELTDQITLDTDRHHSEKLFLARPDIALVSSYSHPTTLQALTNQGIALHKLPAIHSIADIYDTLTQIGMIAHRNHEAELLSLFMEAAMNAIDNQLNSLNLEDQLTKVLYVTHYRNYSTPSDKTITGQLLKRLGILWGIERSNKKTDWSTPIEREELMHFNPTCVIISSINNKQDTTFFSNTIAYQKHNLFFVDETIQNYSSQYIVLAYYDLYRALASAKFT